MLADFGTNVGIVGVKLGEGIFKSVDVGKCEFGFVEGADGAKDV